MRTFKNLGHSLKLLNSDWCGILKKLLVKLGEHYIIYHGVPVEDKLNAVASGEVHQFTQPELVAQVVEPLFLLTFFHMEKANLLERGGSVGDTNNAEVLQ